MEEVLLRLLDDKIWHDRQEKVESAGSHVLELDGQRVKLDLTDENFKELAGWLAPWLAAGRREGEGPVTRLGFKAGSPESKNWRCRLREWADSEGRSSEYLRATPDDSGKNKYTYPRPLVRDFEAYLLAQATVQPAALWAGWCSSRRTCTVSDREWSARPGGTSSGWASLMLRAASLSAVPSGCGATAGTGCSLRQRARGPRTSRG